MNTVFTGEDQLLDEQFRKGLITEIVDAAENRERRAQALRRHEVFLGQSKKWVCLGIDQEGYKKETQVRMKNRATNISFARKIIQKTSRCYVHGVERTVGTPVVSEGVMLPNPDQISVEELADQLDFNTKKKKTARFLRLFQSCLFGTVPILDETESRVGGKQLYRLESKVLAPWQYDVIPHPHDESRAAVVIISDFTDRLRFARWDERGAEGYRTTSGMSAPVSDGRDSVLADRPEDKGQNRMRRRFIVWSDSYHFTMDANGQIIGGSSPSDLGNPIKMLPWTSYAKDAEGYWGLGGDDVVDGDLLLNKILTDVNFITYFQGWGQLVIGAKNVPQKLDGGPDQALIFTKDEIEENVQVFFASSNPPINAWLEKARMLLALLLSTNGLSTRSIAAKLDVTTAPSALALMVEDADVVVEGKDDEEIFRDKEPEEWEVIRRWHEVYRSNGWLVPDQADVEPFADSNVNLKFLDAKQALTEGEALDNLGKMKSIGLWTLSQLIRKVNPDLSEEEAGEKAEELLADRMKFRELFVQTAQAVAGDASGEKEEEDGKPADGDVDSEDDGREAGDEDQGDRERKGSEGDDAPSR